MVSRKRAATRTLASFERLITEPELIASELTRFLALNSPAVRAMVDVVQPRTPKCFDGLLEADYGALSGTTL